MGAVCIYRSFLLFLCSARARFCARVLLSWQMKFTVFPFIRSNGNLKKKTQKQNTPKPMRKIAQLFILEYIINKQKAAQIHAYRSVGKYCSLFTTFFF